MPNTRDPSRGQLVALTAVALLAAGTVQAHARPSPQGSRDRGQDQELTAHAFLPSALYHHAGRWPAAERPPTVTPGPSPTRTPTTTTVPSPTATTVSAPGVPACARTTGDAGGLRFSLDGGATLAPNSTHLAPLAYTWDLDIDPRNPDVLLELHQGTLYRSEDAGCTLHVAAHLDRLYDDLVRAPSNPDLLVATTVFESGIGVSEDGGDTWQPEDVPEDVVHLAIDPADADHWVYVGRTALYERRARDQRWTALPPPLTNDLMVTAAANAPSAWGTWIVGDNTRGIFRTDDLGASWTPVNEGLFGEVGEPPDPVTAVVPVYVAFARRDADIVYLSANRVGREQAQRGLWRSDDGGATWSQRVADGQQVGDRQVVLTGGTRVFMNPADPDNALFAFGSTYAGYGLDLYRSEDGLTTLAVSHFDDFYDLYALAFGPPDSAVVFVAATSDVPAARKSSGGRAAPD